MINTWAEIAPRAPAASAPDEWIEKRHAPKSGAFMTKASPRLKPENTERDMNSIFLDAAGDHYLRDARPGESMGAALARRLTEIGVESAMAALDEIPGGFGIGAVGRRAKILDAYHVSMSAKESALARSVGTMFTRLIETYYDRLIRTFAPFEDFRLAVERRWQPVCERLDHLETTLRRVAEKLG